MRLYWKMHLVFENKCMQLYSNTKNISRNITCTYCIFKHKSTCILFEHSFMNTLSWYDVMHHMKNNFIITAEVNNVKSCQQKHLHPGPYLNWLTLKCVFVKNMGVQFDIIINILVSSSRFIGIPILWDYATAIINILILSVRVLTLDVRIWRLLTVGDGL